MRNIKTVLIYIMLCMNLYAIKAKVIKVSDGDSIISIIDKKKVKIRMFGIDAPEKTQDYGSDSQKYLERAILNKVIDVKVIEKDQYGRTVGKVFYKNEDINLKMIETGNAWHYRKLAPKEKTYFNAEKKAKKSKIGLWRKKALAPWQYRYNQKNKNRNKSKKYS